MLTRNRATTLVAITMIGLSAMPAPQAGVAEVDAPIAARLSPDGESVAFIVGDSIYVSGERHRSVRAVAGGVAFEAQAARKQLVWSPDSRFLLFRRGAPPRMRFTVVEVGSGTITDILPESVAGEMRTVGNFFTGPPAWAPTSDRVAFLATRPGQFGSLDVVYVATLGPDDGWTVRAVASGRGEKTAVGWTARQLVWASYERQDGATLTVAPLSGDTVGTGVLLDAGPARVTALLPSPDGRRLLVTTAGSPPRVVGLGVEPRIVESNLAAAAGLDAYIGWASDSTVLAFRYPTDWTSELALIGVPDGRVRRVAEVDGRIADGSLVRTSRGVEVVLSREDGSHPRSYRSMLLSADGSVRDEGSVTPPRFEPGPDPWTTHIVSWRAADGTRLEAQLLRPAATGADVLPTVIVPYGGYRNTALSTTYFVDLLLRDLLRHGWQVIRPNTSAADVLQQRSGYGAVQLADTHRLLSDLGAEGVIDPARVAVVGHSHGASLAYYYATHSSAFCAVVAVNGRADWAMQARYEADGLLPGPLGASPDENPALYARESPLANAAAVTAPLLLVAGANDSQILPANVTSMADSLRAYRMPFDLLLFNDEGHQIERDVNRRELIARARRMLDQCVNGVRQAGADRMRMSALSGSRLDLLPPRPLQ